MHDAKLVILIVLVLIVAAAFTYPQQRLEVGDVLPVTCNGVPRMEWDNPQSGRVVCDPYPVSGTPAPKPTAATLTPAPKPTLAPASSRVRMTP